MRHLTVLFAILAYRATMLVEEPDLADVSRPKTDQEKLELIYKLHLPVKQGNLTQKIISYLIDDVLVRHTAYCPQCKVRWPCPTVRALLPNF